MRELIKSGDRIIDLNLPASHAVGGRIERTSADRHKLDEAHRNIPRCCGTWRYSRARRGFGGLVPVHGNTYLGIGKPYEDDDVVSSCCCFLIFCFKYIVWRAVSDDALRRGNTFHVLRMTYLQHGLR